jgi:hypothetical protein
VIARTAAVSGGKLFGMLPRNAWTVTGAPTKCPTVLAPDVITRSADPGEPTV